MQPKISFRKLIKSWNLLYRFRYQINDCPFITKFFFSEYTLSKYELFSCSLIFQWGILTHKPLLYTHPYGAFLRQLIPFFHYMCCTTFVSEPCSIRCNNGRKNKNKLVRKWRWVLRGFTVFYIINLQISSEAYNIT